MTNLIIVTGYSASGKTTIARFLAEQLNWVLISKDTIKELLFDELGIKDRAWSKILGKTAIALLFLEVDRHLKVGQNLIIENPFKPEFDEKRFQAYEEDGINVIQIRLWAAAETLKNRFKERSMTSRHPGHQDHTLFDEVLPLLEQEKIPIAKINGPTIDINTTDWPNEAHILSDVKEYLK